MKNAGSGGEEETAEAHGVGGGGGILPFKLGAGWEETEKGIAYPRMDVG